MQKQNILRCLLFVIFFGIGTSVLAGAVLCNDLALYYRSRQLLRSAEESLSRLESLNADYDALLRQLEKDPNLFERIAPATLGTEPADADVNTIYPDVTAEQLDAARRVLAEDSRQMSSKAEVPGWIARCSEPPNRIILFLSGAFLIGISFTCFGPAREGTGNKNS